MAKGYLEYLDKINDCASYQGQPKQESIQHSEKFTDLDYKKDIDKEDKE